MIIRRINRCAADAAATPAPVERPALLYLADPRDRSRLTVGHRVPSTRIPTPVIIIPCGRRLLFKLSDELSNTRAGRAKRITHHGDGVLAPGWRELHAESDVPVSWINRDFYRYLLLNIS